VRAALDLRTRGEVAGVTTRILLVDDHQMVREGLKAILEKDGTFSVVGEASSGRDGVRLAQEFHPDVVVMDVAMGDMNGIEATRQIRALAPHSRVVALSSHSDRRYVKAILDAGASGYILKANAYDHLARGVSAAAQGLNYLSPEVTAEIIESALQRGTDGSVYEILGAREREVLQLLAEGLTSSEIAQRLHVSTSTIETHRRNIMRKLALHNVADLTKYAIREGLTSLDAAPRGAS
jgi:two-component system NarL family response regulator